MTETTPKAGIFNHPCQFISYLPKRELLVCCSGPYLLGFSLTTGEKTFEFCYQDDLQHKNKEAAAYGQAFRQVAFSKDESRMATVSEDKCLRLWEIDEAAKARLCYEKTIPKRCADMKFHDSGDLVFGDKFGDIYRVNEQWFKNASSENQENTASENKEEKKESKEDWKLEPIMGHVSILTQLCLTNDPRKPDQEIIVSSDRDEHIRISRFPSAYVIEGFCMGHEDFVSRISLYDNSTLISGGGDNHVFLWDLKTCQCLDAFDVRSAFANYLSADKPMVISSIIPIPSRNLIAFACEGIAGLIFAKVSSEKRLAYHSALPLAGPVLHAIFLHKTTDYIIASLDSSVTFGPCFQTIGFTNEGFVQCVENPTLERIENEGLIKTDTKFCPLAQLHTMRKNHSKFLKAESSQQPKE
ncbi:tRNA (guanine-N7-)-methyltransferase subunit Trm82 [Schizosaccharomyces cryophilus OY26]|uniref:tRNA (Guanine-N7-)-methyltransferase subunit Trm82 n=1 Tax=Schizosaccharomyces cryophilus (strain OY26 / ATCC MYA-4695 / CBS 11777 / NBRC 106824 / NRRL Y48691) TaxID=653667 RepID=S9XBN5_SCHCR|nr:tRNA (guanine-N7-)-methyltransferase subunit Trm82 [Schizosaccharomyces cryophilus OY26]EPY51226.1 tRNA (guanine-N7-)-methyltransferase subunit Trm82 [Schizosaccharomyces cryophilus OY26]